MGLDPGPGSIVSAACLMCGNLKEDGEKILRASRGAFEKMKEDALSRGKPIDFMYMNYS